MTCVLTVYRPSGTLPIPLLFSGRMAVHLDGGGSFEVENAPAIASDQGGELPIYREDVLAFSVPFTCPGARTYSAGSSGGGTCAGASEGGASSAGARVGRLF